MNSFKKNNTLLLAQSIRYSPGQNSANYYQRANWNGSESLSTTGNVTTVGTNGGPSSYGTYDQSGNVEEILENYSGNSTNMYRALGNYRETFPYMRYVDLETNLEINALQVFRGFRVCSINNPNSYNNYVTVYDSNNAAASNGYGGVSYAFLSNKYLVTNNDYIEYLIAIATIDPLNASKVYINDMRTNLSGGINRTQTGGSGASSIWSYNIRSNMGNKPVNFVSWKMAARYINWLHNGKPSGSQNSSTTEDGAYDMALSIPVRKTGAKYFLPNINEWTKSGFYKGGSTNAGYWNYATQSNIVPIPVYSTVDGNGIIPSIVLGNLKNDYSKTTTTIVSVPDAALGFNTNNDTRLRTSSIVLRTTTIPTSISIYSNNSGIPGTLLYSSVGALSIGNGFYRYYFSGQTLSSNTIYWVIPGVNWGLTTENGTLSNINNTPITMNGSSYSFVDVLRQVGGIWSPYNPAFIYQRNLTFSLECY